MIFERLIDKVLHKITVTDDQEQVVFHTNDGQYPYRAEGDCCSESWIEHFDEVKADCIIQSVEEIEISQSREIHKPTKHTNHSEEEMEYSFYKVVTDKGYLMIEMRNSSNGYYGGILVEMDKVDCND